MTQSGLKRCRIVNILLAGDFRDQGTLNDAANLCALQIDMSARLKARA